MPSFFLLMQRKGAVVRAVPCKANTVENISRREGSSCAISVVISARCSPPLFDSHCCWAEQCICLESVSLRGLFIGGHVFGVYYGARSPVSVHHSTPYQHSYGSCVPIRRPKQEPRHMQATLGIHS